MNKAPQSFVHLHIYRTEDSEFNFYFIIAHRYHLLLPSSYNKHAKSVSRDYSKIDNTRHDGTMFIVFPIYLYVWILLTVDGYSWCVWKNGEFYRSQWDHKMLMNMFKNNTAFQCGLHFMERRVKFYVSNIIPTSDHG